MALYLEPTKEPELDVRAYKANQPKFSPHSGRTWDCFPFWFIDSRTNEAVRVDCCYDTTRGSYWYFEWQGQWYRVSFDHAEHHPVLAHRHGYDLPYVNWSTGKTLFIVRYMNENR